LAAAADNVVASWCAAHHVSLFPLQLI